MCRGLFLFGLSVICIFAVSFSYAVEEEDILVYYAFDKLSGNKVTDDSGNGNDAELVGKGSLVDGAVQQSDTSEWGCRPDGAERLYRANRRENGDHDGSVVLSQ